MTLGVALLVIAAAAAAYTDVRWGKIPNFLVTLLLVAGLALQAFLGWHSLLVAVAAGLAAFAAGFALFAMRIMGGGDVKFFIAAVAAAGPHDGAAFVLYTLISGALVALAFALARGQIGTLFSNLRAGALTMSMPASSLKMPYAVAMLAGALALLASQTILPALRIPL